MNQPINRMTTKDTLLPRPYVSSGSDEGDGVTDMKKKRRMVSNRESAKKSRMKKQRHLQDMIIEVDHLTKQSKKMAEKIDGLLQKYDSIRLENDALMAQKKKMENKFEYLMNVLDNVERHHKAYNHQGYYYCEPFGENLGEPCYTQGLDDVMKRPWQVASTSQPIMTSQKMLTFES